jgi:ABC-type transporter Mla subunit MlaD
VTEQGTTAPRNPADLAGQLREAADRIMAGWTSMTAGGSGSAATPSFPKLPRMPATMSAEQMETFLQDLAARRAQVQALVTQLERFDEQLGTLEAGVRPFVEWTRTWADLEKTMTDFWRPPSGSSG